MKTKQGLTKEQSATYQGALEAVLAVPIAAGFGYGFDYQFDTGPVGPLAGVGIGFGAMLLRIVRMRPAEAPPESPGPQATDESTLVDDTTDDSTAR